MQECAVLLRGLLQFGILIPVIQLRKGSRSWLPLALLAFCCLLISCAGPTGRTDSDATASLSTETEAEEPIEVSDPYAEILPPDLVESVINLQAAIDMRRQQGASDCMRQGGFEYRPEQRTLQPIETNAVEDALSLFDPSFESPAPQQLDPNKEIRDSLTPEEFDEWDLYLIDCIVNSPHNIAHPIVAESAWWSTVQSDASDLVQADPRFIDAVQTEAKCYAEAGYGEGLAATLAEIDERALELAIPSTTPTEELVARLHELLDERAGLEAVGDSCLAPRLAATRRVFAETLATRVNDDPQMGLWLAELRRTVESYEPELSQILDG